MRTLNFGSIDSVDTGKADKSHLTTGVLSHVYAKSIHTFFKFQHFFLLIALSKQKHVASNGSPRQPDGGSGSILAVQEQPHHKSTALQNRGRELIRRSTYFSHFLKILTLTASAVLP